MEQKKGAMDTLPSNVTQVCNLYTYEVIKFLYYHYFISYFTAF